MRSYLPTQSYARETAGTPGKTQNYKLYPRMADAESSLLESSSNVYPQSTKERDLTMDILGEASRGSRFYEEERRMQLLESEKINLIKRLNLALVELDRLTQEKVELASKVRERARMTEDFERRLEKAHNLTSLITKNMQEDIQYQRDQNEKIKVELAAREREKSDYLLDAKAQEDMIDRAKDEAMRKQRDLERGQEELEEIEGNYAALVEGLRELTEEAEGKRCAERVREDEKEDMKATLERVIDERNDLIARMNNLTEKYEKFVRTLDEDKEGLGRANRKHTKLLCSSILFSFLNNRIMQNKASALENVRKMAVYRGIVSRRLLELARVREGYVERTIAGAFSVWRHGQLRWADERRVNEDLIERRTDRKRKFKYFMQWRQEYWRSSDRGDKQIEAARRITVLKKMQARKRVREYWIRWAQTGRRCSRRDWLLKRVLRNGERREKSESLLNWLQATKAQRQDRKYERLADEFAEEKFKRVMLARLRYNVNLAEDEKVAYGNSELRNHHEGRAKNRFLKAATLTFMGLNRKKEDALKAEANEALKFNVLSEMKGRTEAKLVEEGPKIEEREQEIQEISLNHFQSQRASLLKSALFTFRRRLRYFFERWRNLLPLERDNCSVLRRVLMRWQCNKLKAAFDLWHSKKRLQELAQKRLEERSAARQLEDLGDKLQLLDIVLEGQGKHLHRFAVGKIERIGHIVGRALLRRRFRLWREGARYLHNVAAAGMKLRRMMHKFSKQEALDRLRSQTAAIRSAMCELYKTRLMNSVMERSIVKRFFRRMREEARKRRLGKKAIYKWLRREHRGFAREYLKRWRDTAHEISSCSLAEANTELKDGIVDVDRGLEVQDKLKLDTAEAISECRGREARQATEVQQKYLVLWMNRRLQDAFRNWRDRSLKLKKTSLLLGRYLLKHEHNNLRAALAQWRASSFFQHLHQVNEDLKRRVGRHETFSRISDLQIGENEEECRELKEVYNQLRRDHTMDRTKAEKTSEILGRLKQYCIKYSVNNNYLLAWMEAFRKERELISKARIISKMHFGKYVFARLKQVGLLNKGERDTQDRWSRCVNCFSHFQLRGAVQKWRERAKNHYVMDQTVEIEDQRRVLAEKEQELGHIKDRSNTIYEREIAKRRAGKTLRVWSQLAQFQKLMGRKSEQLGDALRTIRLSRSFTKWRADATLLDKAEYQAHIARESHNSRALANAFHGWKSVFRGESALPKLLHRISCRQYLNHLSLACVRLVTFGRAAEQEEGHSREEGATRLFAALSRMRHGRLAGALANLHDHNYRRHFSKETLRRMFSRAYNKRLQEHFTRWRHQSDQLRLIDEIEAKGQSAQLVSQIIRKHSSTKKLMKEEKVDEMPRSAIRLVPVSEEEEPVISYSRKPGSGPGEEEKQKPVTSLYVLPEHRRPYMEEKSDLSQKYITRWLRKLAGCDLVGKYLDAWRQWLHLRQLMEKHAKMIVQRIQHGGKAWAFDKLRHLRRAAQKTYERVPRHEIVKKIADGDRDISLLQRETETLDANITMFAKRKEKLDAAVSRGKRLACGVFVKMLGRPIKAYLRKWKLNAEQEMISELAGVLQQKVQGFGGLRGISSELSTAHSSLMLENEDLRQASMDGIEIASMVQTIAREREQMSCDLSNRSLTVKKLIEENYLLQQRLSIAQAEAERLLKLTHTS